VAHDDLEGPRRPGSVRCRARQILGASVIRAVVRRGVTIDAASIDPVIPNVDATPACGHFNRPSSGIQHHLRGEHRRCARTGNKFALSTVR